MKRRRLVVIPAVFLLLIGITFAAEQPAVSISETVGDRMVQPQQPARELQNQIDALARQLEALGEVPRLPPGVINRNSPLLSEPPGNMPFSFEQPNEPPVVARSPFGEPRPFQYNGMTFWWIPLSAAAPGAQQSAAPGGTVKLVEPK